jgi:biofilm protein TabA
MFLGHLSDWERQRQLLPAAVVTAIETVRALDLSTYATGRHDIDGERVIFWLNENTTQAHDLCRPEMHATYADVQWLLTGEECIGVCPAFPRQAPQEDQLAEYDLAFFQHEVAGESLLQLTAGGFVFIPPLHIHRPLVCVDAPLSIRKVVIKIHKDLLFVR